MPDNRMVNKLLYHLKGVVRLLLALLIGHEGHAQCGSVGDPIVNITFGTATNPDFDGRNTTYFHNQTSELNDGDYRLGSNVNQGRGGWHNLRDHTEEQEEGMMMLVNASFDAGEFYRARVKGLCQQTKFVFSAWIAVANPITACPDNGGPELPNVRFVIEDIAGNEIASRSTGDIPATAQPQWLSFEFVFDTGAETEFDIVLINDNPGGCGNDLAIDDIQFRPCGPLITLAMDETLKQADTLFFCEGDNTPISLGSEITSDDGYAATPAYQWQARQDEQATWTDILGENSDKLSIVPAHNQWYRLTATGSAANLGNLLCRISSNPIRIARIAPQADDPDIQEAGPICEDGSIPLNPPEYTGANVGPVTYQWLLDDGNGNEPIEMPGATSSHYEFQAEGTVGTVRLRRQAINICGDRFITHSFDVEVMGIIHTTFTLPRQVICADDEPLLLSGGAIINGDAGMQGVYSGKGVSNGYFYPDMAGVGPHTITFSPPAGTLCPEPSQATITVYDTIYLDPMLTIVMLPGQHVTLRPQTNATQFRWSNQPGLDSYEAQYPVASPTATTTYTLTAANVAGCEKIGQVTVTVLQDLIVANSFTPNGDGANETWEIDGLEEYPNTFIQVFNRWGTLVFSSKGYPAPWDGQFNGAQLPVGTYYYTLSSDVLAKPVSGSVTILR